MKRASLFNKWLDAIIVKASNDNEYLKKQRALK